MEKSNKVSFLSKYKETLKVGENMVIFKNGLRYVVKPIDHHIGYDVVVTIPGKIFNSCWYLPIEDFLVWYGDYEISVDG